MSLAAQDTSGPKGVRKLRVAAYRWVRRRAASRLNLAPAARQGGSNTGFSKVPIDAEIVVHFGDDASRIYQLEQWLPVFEALNERHKVLIVARNERTFELLRSRPLPVVYLRRLRELSELFAMNPFKVVLYVNNSALNFSSLLFQDVMHVHLNHGESDKIATNQAKAYDRVLVAGQAAVDRYNAKLLEFHGRNLVVVGRPQLDVDYGRPLGPSPRPTVLYAPTWGGGRDEMNYSSVDVYGARIVSGLLAGQKYRVVYKPHPRVPGDANTAQAHAEIVAAIEQAQTADPAGGHVVEVSAPIISLFADCDTMISDVSSVGMDFLYLATAKPMFLADRLSNAKSLGTRTRMAACSVIVNDSNVDTIAAMVAEALATDAHRDARERMRRYYFDDIEPGESTVRFLEAIDEVVAARDAAVAARPSPSSIDGAAGPVAATG